MISDKLTHFRVSDSSNSENKTTMLRLTQNFEDTKRIYEMSFSKPTDKGTMYIFSY